METELMNFPYRIVDLTHPITPGMPVWPGDPESDRKVVARLERDGYNLSVWTVGEHSGTHLGAPAHFDAQGTTVDALSSDRLVLPLAVVELAADGSIMGAAELARDEELHGKIPSGALVTLRTGWDRRWPDPQRVFERDAEGRYTWPGFTPEAVEYLIAERKQLGGLGTDTPGIDPGMDDEFRTGRTVAEYGGIHVENLANLERMPARGGWIVLAALPLVGGSGSPLRALGLVAGG